MQAENANDIAKCNVMYVPFISSYNKHHVYIHHAFVSFIVRQKRGLELVQGKGTIRDKYKIHEKSNQGTNRMCACFTSFIVGSFRISLFPEMGGYRR